MKHCAPKAPFCETFSHTVLILLLNMQQWVIIHKDVNRLARVSTLPIYISEGKNASFCGTRKCWKDFSDRQKIYFVILLYSINWRAWVVYRSLCV